MPASAHDVAAAIRRRLPGVALLKLHKLLYFCQGHHLAWFGEPLFVESLQAWNHGPVVAEVWLAEHYNEPPEVVNDLDNGQLNTVGYVISRYGTNTGHDLEIFTHHEGPWEEAYRRESGDRDRHTIFVDSLRAFFLEVHATDHAEDEFEPDPEALAAFLAGAHERREQPAAPDTRESLLARLNG